MENGQFSILTALFGGKAAGGASHAAKTVFGAPSENSGRAAEDAQGFFSFLEGLLKPQEEGSSDASNPFGAQPIYAAPAIEIARDRLKAPIEPVITTGAVETLGVAVAPAEGQISTAAAPVEDSVVGAKAPKADVETLSTAQAGRAGVESARMETPAAAGVAAEAQGPVLSAGEESPVKAIHPSPVAKTAETTEAVMEPDAPEFKASPETSHDKTGKAPDILSAPRHGAKAPSFAAGASANAAGAIAEQASPEALSHSALTRDAGDLEFDRLASSRFDTVSSPADRNTHLHAVRDQIGAAVTARHSEGKLEIRLDPPELGRVTIGFESDGADIVRAVISADTPQTLDLMRRHADVFQRELEDQGFAGLDLQFADHGPRQNQTEESGDKTYAFGLAEEDASAVVAAAAAPTAALGRLDRRL